ncbi:MAG: sulfite exporter TauE/SafE family protein [Candidatus Acidiferrales bacterium]
MNSLTFTLLIWVGSLLGGYLGSLVGLGGGVVVVPLLTLIFHVDIHYAIGAALVSVIATSSGAAAAYVREGYSNVRVGMFLEMATTTGALVGAALVLYLQATLISIIFGVVLLYSAYTSMRPIPKASRDVPPDKISTWLRMDSTYPEGDHLEKYHVHNVPGGFGIMFLAGILSGLLGIGSGAVKVLAMDKVMKLPFKVSTTTSNFMIGVTAAAGAGIYLSRGYIDPGLAMPVMLGVLAGSFAGARTLAKARVNVLRLVFAVVIGVMAVEMIYSGFTGRM